MKTISILGTQKRAILNHSDRNGYYMVMEPLTKEQEDAIDESRKKYGSIRFVKEIGGKKYTFMGSDIYLYGNVNLKSPADVNYILKTNISSREPYDASLMMSNFDYDSGTVTTSKDGRILWTNTWNRLKWFKYNYTLIGKPARIIIFKMPKMLCMGS